MPIAISLRDYVPSSTGLRGLATAAIRRFVYMTDDELSQFMLTRTLVYLLDGLDEVPGLSPLNAVRELLTEIEDLLNSGAGGHCVVMTSRTTLFSSQLQEGRLRDFQRYYIDPWGRRQWDICVSSLALEPAAYERLLSLYNLPGLAAKPLFARLILQHRDRVLKATSPLTQSALYNFYITDTLQYQVIERGGALDEESKRQAMRNVAMEMFTSNTDIITAEQIESVARGLSRGDMKACDVVHDIQTACLLERLGDAYQFTHKSVMEYLVAEQLVMAIETDDYEVFCRRYVYNEVWEFMAPLVDSAHVDKLLDKLSTLTERHFFATAIVLIRRLNKDRKTSESDAYAQTVTERYTRIITERILDESPGAIQARLVAAFGAYECCYTKELGEAIRAVLSETPSGILARILWYTLKHFEQHPDFNDALPPGPTTEVFEPEYARQLLLGEETAIHSFLIADGGVASNVDYPIWIVRMATSLVLSSHRELRLLPRLLADIVSTSDLIRENAWLSLDNLQMYYQLAREPDKLSQEVRKAVDVMEEAESQRTCAALAERGFTLNTQWRGLNA